MVSKAARPIDMKALRMMKTLSGVIAALLLGGCTLIPTYHRPDHATPDGWRNGANAQASAAADQPLAPDWWRSFNSSELNELMTIALAQNNDIRAAIERIRQANAQVDIAEAPLFPSLEGTGNVNYSHSSGGRNNTISTASGAGLNSTSTGLTTAVAAGGTGVSATRTTRSYNTGLNAAYQLDLFGANRSSAREAEATALSSVYAQQALALTTMADTANAYFLVLNLRERVRIAQENLKSSEDILRIINARFTAGAASGLEVAQEKTNVATSQADLAALQRQEAQGEDALAVLVAKPPAWLTVRSDTLKDVDVPDLSPSQPSTLLQRRPDMREAEADLIAANADIGVVRANFFPTIDLGAGLSIAANPFNAPVSKVVSGNSSLLAPIFEGNLLEGQLALSKARKAELVENYRKTVLQSYQEVEDALVAVKAASAREDALKDGTRQARRAYALSRDLYNSGAVDFQTLLNAQQALLTTEDQYAAVRLEQLEAAVSLYSALGGGWQTDEAATADTTEKKAAKPPQRGASRRLGAPAAGPDPATN